MDGLVLTKLGIFNTFWGELKQSDKQRKKKKKWLEDVEKKLGETFFFRVYIVPMWAERLYWD